MLHVLHSDNGAAERQGHPLCPATATLRRDKEDSRLRMRLRRAKGDRSADHVFTSSDQSANQVPSTNGLGPDPFGKVRRLPCPDRDALSISCRDERPTPLKTTEPTSRAKIV